MYFGIKGLITVPTTLLLTLGINLDDYTSSFFGQNSHLQAIWYYQNVNKWQLH
jgi:hypothetical protein